MTDRGRRPSTFFTAAAALSLLVAVIVTFAWVRSCRTWDRVVWLRDHRQIEFSSGLGTVAVDWSDFITSPDWLEEPHLYPARLLRSSGASPTALWQREDLPTSRALLGVRFGKRGLQDVAFVVLPYWVVTSVPLILPARWAWRIWRGRRAVRLNLCRSCGYDLRASNDRCPECGAAVA